MARKKKPGSKKKGKRSGKTQKKAAKAAKPTKQTRKKPAKRPRKKPTKQAQKKPPKQARKKPPKQAAEEPPVVEESEAHAEAAIEAAVGVDDSPAEAPVDDAPAQEPIEPEAEEPDVPAATADTPVQADPTTKAPEESPERDAGPDSDDDAAVIALDADDGEDAVVIDLDADDGEDAAVIDLDDDDDTADAVERLIAETLAGVPEAEQAPEPDEPTIDLDADGDEIIPEAVHADESAPLGSDVTISPTDDAPAEQVGADEEVGEPTEATTDAGAALVEEEAARESIDRGATSSPEVRDRLLAAALADAEHRDARYRVPFTGPATARRWKVLAAAVILLMAGVASVAPPRWARPQPPAELGAGDRARNLRMALLLQAEQVEAYRIRTQRLPATPAELTAVLPGVRYVRSGSRAYQLVAYEADGNAIVYDSGSPASDFDDLRAGWAGSGPPR